MRFKWPPTIRVDRSHWHTWFAWRPVITLDGEMVWLEIIERIDVMGTWSYMPLYKTRLRVCVSYYAGGGGNDETVGDVSRYYETDIDGRIIRRLWFGHFMKMDVNLRYQGWSIKDGSPRERMKRDIKLMKFELPRREEMLTERARRMK